MTTALAPPVDAQLTLELSEEEQSTRSRLEDVIRQGLKTFVAVGTAMAEIRDRKLYRNTHTTFRDYCQEVWGLSISYVDRQMAAAEVVANLQENAPIGVLLPANEAQARELAKLPPAEQPEAWQEAVERTDGRPTAAAVREVVDERLPEPEPETPPVAAPLDLNGPDDEAEPCPHCGETGCDNTCTAAITAGAAEIAALDAEKAKAESEAAGASPEEIAALSEAPAPAPAEPAAEPIQTETIPEPDQNQTKAAPAGLPCVTELYPELLDETLPEDDRPSCSLAEALESQDLMINQAVATWGLELLWRLFRDGGLDHHGFYINLADGRVNPIPVPSKGGERENEVAVPGNRRAGRRRPARHPVQPAAA